MSYVYNGEVQIGVYLRAGRSLYWAWVRLIGSLWNVSRGQFS